jgi:hypothetical protein
MTYTPGTWKCDVCEEPVDEFEALTLSTSYCGKGDNYRPGWLGHYHVECWREISGEIRALAQEGGRERDPLAMIPVATQRQIDDRRDLHRLPDGRRFGIPDDDLRSALKGVAYKAVRALPRAGVRTLADAAAMTDEQLLAIPGIGTKTVQAIRSETRARGLTTDHVDRMGGD